MFKECKSELLLCAPEGMSADMFSLRAGRQTRKTLRCRASPDNH